MMNDQGKSHSSIVPEKSLNKAQAAEGVEGHELAKGKTLEQNTLRTQDRGGGRVGRTLGGHETRNGRTGKGKHLRCAQNSVQGALERIREAAKDKKQRFITALLHHIYSVELLKESYFVLQ